MTVIILRNRQPVFGADIAVSLNDTVPFNTLVTTVNANDPDTNVVVSSN